MEKQFLGSPKNSSVGVQTQQYWNAPKMSHHFSRGRIDPNRKVIPGTKFSFIKSLVKFRLISKKIDWGVVNVYHRLTPLGNERIQVWMSFHTSETGAKEYVCANNSTRELHTSKYGTAFVLLGAYKTNLNQLKDPK